MKRSSPCYDIKTKTDCPDRCAGCSITCNKWKEYTSERNEVYKRARYDNDYFGHVVDKVIRLRKNKHPRRKIEKM